MNPAENEPAAEKTSPALDAGPARTCRICLKRFTVNGEKACRYHPESFSGETAQRWLPPGTKGGDVVHNFYSCCGGGIDSIGCCWTRHRTFDEPEDVTMRQPGMGVEP